MQASRSKSAGTSSVRVSQVRSVTRPLVRSTTAMLRRNMAPPWQAPVLAPRERGKLQSVRREYIRQQPPPLDDCRDTPVTRGVHIYRQMPIDLRVRFPERSVFHDDLNRRVGG